MGSSRDLMDEEVEDANATVISNGGRIPSGSYITPIPYPHTSVMPYPHASVGAQGSNVNKPFSFDINGISPHGVPTGGLTINNPSVHSEMVVMTSHGKVKINLDTGVLTIPHGIGREEAIRDFWLGFQENFRGAEKTKYEDEIASLKRDISHITQKAEEYKNEVSDIAKKSIVKKIAEKYGNEKFIMIKPADLIKMIEGA